MKNILLFVLLAFPLMAIGQKENENYKTIADGLVRLLNEGKYQEVYDMYSPVLRKYQNAKASEEYLDGAIKKYGQIKNANFLKFQQNYGVYLLSGEKGNFLLRISLDEQRRLVALNISPVKPTP